MSKSISPRNLTYSALLCALLCISAFIRFPLFPFPVQFTLQVLIVFIIAGLLNPVYCAITISLYIVLGLSGLPVFSAGGGIGYILTPYFGYILGFLFGSMAMSKIYSSRLIKRKLVAYGLGAVTAIIIIYTIGVIYMYLIMNLYLKSSITFFDTVYKGALIFIALDIFKAVIAYLILNALEKATGITRRPKN